MKNSRSCPYRHPSVRPFTAIRSWCDGQDLIRGLLTLEPKDRLTATQALNHPWIVADGEDLASNDLSLTLDSLRLFNAKRKLRGSIHQVGAASLRCRAVV